MITLAEIKRFFTNAVTANDVELAKFKNDLETNAVHAFSWAESAMRTAARAQVANHYLVSISVWESARDAVMLSPAQPQDEEAVVKFICESIMRQAIRGNAYVERSTSVTSNFMRIEENSYYAYIASEWDIING
jgi:hypothetical protein